MQFMKKELRTDQHGVHEDHEDGKLPCSTVQRARIWHANRALNYCVKIYGVECQVPYNSKMDFKLEFDYRFEHSKTIVRLHAKAENTSNTCNFFCHCIIRMFP